jgi:hypothetical protein
MCKKKPDLGLNRVSTTTLSRLQEAASNKSDALCWIKLDPVITFFERAD